MLAENQIVHSDVIPQRSCGRSRVSVHWNSEATRLRDFFQEGCAKVRLPKTHDPARMEAVMINTAGGMTGGDRIDWQFEAGQGTILAITSQACERIYQSSGGVAEINVSLKARSGSSLCWLPQETILFNQCSARRHIQVHMEDDARLLLVEPLIFGREAMGETICEGRFRDDWLIRHNNGLVHIESARFQGNMENLLKKKAVMDGNIAGATVLLLAPESSTDLENKLRKAQMITQGVSGNRGGASLWTVGTTGKLLARVIAKNGYELRNTLVPLVNLFNDDAALPKSWAL